MQQKRRKECMKIVNRNKISKTLEHSNWSEIEINPNDHVSAEKWSKSNISVLNAVRYSKITKRFVECLTKFTYIHDLLVQHVERIGDFHLLVLMSDS